MKSTRHTVTQHSALSTRHCRARAYSLVEMLVVLVIIGILSSTLMGAYGRFQRNARLSTSTEKVISTLALARSLAISNNAVYHVRLEHWDKGTTDYPKDEPNKEPALVIFCHKDFTTAVGAPTDPASSEVSAWNYTGRLKNPDGTPLYNPKGAPNQPYNNYIVDTTKLDPGIYIGYQFPSTPAVDPIKDAKQNNLIAFYPDGTTNQSARFTLFVTDTEKMAHSTTDWLVRKAAFNEDTGATYTRGNVQMIDVLRGGIIRLRTEDLP